jgi:hypothetical protein
LALAVGGDVVDGVGGHAARVDDDVGHKRAVEDGLDAKVEVGHRAGDGGAQVGVGVANVNKLRPGSTQTSVRAEDSERLGLRLESLVGGRVCLLRSTGHG